MASLTTASGSRKGSDVLLSIRDRLVETLELDQSKVRIVLRPGPVPKQYQAEKNVALRFSSPDPDVYAGAGRYGQLVHRTMEVWVSTQSLSDVAGDDEVFAVAHLDFEERVIDALRMFRPEDLQTANEAYPVNILFMPGGSDMERQVKADYGMGMSCLLFQVTYQLEYTVVRD